MGRHFSPESVAAFAEGSLSEIDYARVYSHLRCCPECFENYQYTLRCFGVHLDEWKETNAPSASTRREIEEITQQRISPTKNRRRTRRFRFGPALMLALYVAISWLRGE